jgi:hypothetical protein
VYVAQIGPRSPIGSRSKDRGRGPREYPITRTRRPQNARHGFVMLWLANLKRGIAPQYIRTITARERLLNTSSAPRTATSSIVSTDIHPYRRYRRSHHQHGLFVTFRQSAFFGQRPIFVQVRSFLDRPTVPKPWPFPRTQSRFSPARRLWVIRRQSRSSCRSSNQDNISSELNGRGGRFAYERLPAHGNGTASALGRALRNFCRFDFVSFARAQL